ncbi:hypothetical protein BDR26DRAFT_934666 [Obelidium mucronatum]|nr:hypothetical protein BDR26DRAFT_934666 [Obelidium mucronatum]
MRVDTTTSENLLGLTLPTQIMEQIETGVVPGPEQFKHVTAFFTVKNKTSSNSKLVSSQNPSAREFAIYIKFDHLQYISSLTKLLQSTLTFYKVESITDT